MKLQRWLLYRGCYKRTNKGDFIRASEVESLEAKCCALEKDNEELQELHLRRHNDYCAQFAAMVRKQEELEKLLAENAERLEYWKKLALRLKCCGNCVHYYHSDEELCAGCKEPDLKKWKEKD